MVMSQSDVGINPTIVSPHSVDGMVQVCVCAGCGEKILDRYYLAALDRQWHSECLRCAECSVLLEEESSCFTKDNQIYCRADYHRKFSVKQCARCQLQIGSNELVMRAKDSVYHLNCFSCAACQALLMTGDQFGMRDSMIFCRHHFDLVETAPPQCNMGAGMEPMHHHGMAFYGTQINSKGRPRKRKGSGISDITGGGDSMCSSGLGYISPGSMNGMNPDGTQMAYSSSSRQKRNRTSFKPHQLKMMRRYFECNHNPDSKDLQKLATNTGLQKRVLQVWFQNARAKFRRQQHKLGANGAQPGEGAEKSGDGGEANGSFDEDSEDEMTNGESSPPEISLDSPHTTSQPSHDDLVTSSTPSHHMMNSKQSFAPDPSKMFMNQMHGMSDRPMGLFVSDPNANLYEPGSFDDFSKLVPPGTF